LRIYLSVATCGYVVGINFHNRCVENRPNSYYIKLEEVAAKFETASHEELPRLMKKIQIIGSETCG